MNSGVAKRGCGAERVEPSPGMQISNTIYEMLTQQFCIRIPDRSLLTFTNRQNERYFSVKQFLSCNNLHGLRSTMVTNREYNGSEDHAVRVIDLRIVVVTTESTMWLLDFEVCRDLDRVELL